MPDPQTTPPPLSDDAWKFLNEQNVDALNGGVTFEGDWGNWNWLWAEIYKRSVK